jgi:hypothetical protein
MREAGGTFLPPPQRRVQIFDSIPAREYVVEAAGIDFRSA